MKAVPQKPKLEEVFYWTNTLLEWQNQEFQNRVQKVNMVPIIWFISYGNILLSLKIYSATNEPSKSSENKIELDHLEHSWKDELEITAEAKINQSLIPKTDEVSEGFKSRKKSKKAKMRDRKQLSFDDE